MRSTIRRRKGRIEGLIVAICGDVLHSRVARSNIHLLNKLGARVRLVAPFDAAADGHRRTSASRSTATCATGSPAPTS